MSSEEQKTKQLIARVETILGLHAKMHDELLSIKRALEGANPVGEVMAFFDEVWRGRYAVPNSPSSASNGPHGYVWNRSVDPAHIKRLLKVMDALTLKGRIAAFFNDKTPSLVQAKHPFNFFIARINSYVPARTGIAGEFGLTDETPAGCKHSPPCKTDAEHTRRRMSEMRA